MNKVRIKLHSTGVRALLKGAEMQDILKEQAAAVAARCGDGYESRVGVAKSAPWRTSTPPQRMPAATTTKTTHWRRH